MVADLCMGVDVVGVETVREEDGLALSSRNRYLDPEQRHASLALSRALVAGAEAAAEIAEDSASGPADRALAAARAVLRDAHGVDLDYLDVTGPDLGPAPDRGPARMLIAARVGTTRLIDNTALTLGGRAGSI
jgi:pantoate--beta-alanine ligase